LLSENAKVLLLRLDAWSRARESCGHGLSFPGEIINALGPVGDVKVGAKKILS